jgi:hypothetical protein
VRMCKALAHLAVEDLVAETLAGDDVVHVLRQGETEERSGSCEALAVLEQDSGCGHVGSFGQRRLREGCWGVICVLRVRKRYAVSRKT